MNSHCALLRRAVAAATLLSLFVSEAHATGRTAIDFTATDTGSPSAIGQFFTEPNDPTTTGNCASGIGPASCVLHLSGDQTTDAINLGFNVAIGGTSYSSLFINENGIVTFGTPITSGSAWTPELDLAALTALVPQPYIAASYADLDTTGTNTTFFDLSDSAVMYQRGQATVDETQTGTLLPAFAVEWDDANLDGGFVAQLMLYSLDPAGDFALRFRDGSAISANINIGQLIGYSLGSSTGSFAAPLDENTDYSASISGSGGGGNPTPVPEPTTLALMVLALLPAAGIWHRHRARLLALQVR